MLGGSQEAVVTALALTGFIPAVLAKELVRNFSLAHVRLRNALKIDIATCLLQLAGLAYLAAASEVTILSGLAMIGAVSSGIAVTVLYVTRSEFSWGGVAMRDLIDEIWASGKWFAASRLRTHPGLRHVVAHCLDHVRMTAVLAACLSIVGLANPIVQGLYIILAPQAVLACRSEGMPRSYSQSVARRCPACRDNDCLLRRHPLGRRKRKSTPLSRTSIRRIWSCHSRFCVCDVRRCIRHACFQWPCHHGYGPRRRGNYSRHRIASLRSRGRGNERVWSYRGSVCDPHLKRGLDHRAMDDVSAFCRPACSDLCSDALRPR